MALRRLAFMFVLSMATTAAIAQEEPPPPQPPMPPQEQQVTPPVPPAPVETPAEPETTGTREVAAEVVSPDAPAKAINVKIKIKKEGAPEPEVKEARIKVDDEAVPDLDTVSPGDKVKLLCRMNGNSVIAVKDIKTDKPTQ